MGWPEYLKSKEKFVESVAPGIQNVLGGEQMSLAQLQILHAALADSMERFGSAIEEMERASIDVDLICCARGLLGKMTTLADECALKAKRLGEREIATSRPALRIVWSSTDAGLTS